MGRADQLEKITAIIQSSGTKQQSGAGQQSTAFQRRNPAPEFCHAPTDGGYRTQDSGSTDQKAVRSQRMRMITVNIRTDTDRSIDQKYGAAKGNKSPGQL